MDGLFGTGDLVPTETRGPVSTIQVAEILQNSLSFFFFFEGFLILIQNDVLCLYSAGELWSAHIRSLVSLLLGGSDSGL